MRGIAIAIAVPMVVPLHAGAQARQQTIPFVGCPADGQAGHLDPPRGVPKVVVLHDVPAQSIAYYKAEDGPGVFAPRGWHCRSVYGSSGGTLIVTPTLVDSTVFPPAKTRGYAVEMSDFVGGTSGRFDVAIYASRLFPRVAAKFIERVKNEGIVPTSEFERGPYSNDSVKNLDSTVVAFTTPSNAKGLGTEQYLNASEDPIRGIAVLYDSDPAEPDMSIVRVRLGANARQEMVAILRLNKECMQKGDRC